MAFGVEILGMLGYDTHKTNRYNAKGDWNVALLNMNFGIGLISGTQRWNRRSLQFLFRYHFSQSNLHFCSTLPQSRM